jgi:hypothetical protein
MFAGRLTQVAPLSVAVRPLPEESAAAVPEVSSNR